MYKLYTALPGTLTEKGTVVDPTTKPIVLANNWNWIGFISVRNMPVSQALGNLNASGGDVIKSKTQFATYDATLAAWIGSLKVMKPGEGYMYKSVGSKTFTYPIAGMFNNSLTDDSGEASYTISNNVADAAAGKWQVKHESFNTNMTILGSIRTECGETLTGDHYAIGIFDAEGRARGKAAIEKLNVQEVSYLTIAGTEGENFDIRLLNLQEGTEIDLHQTLPYETNNHMGELENPFMINISDAVCLQINPAEVVRENTFTVFPTVFTESFTVDYLAETEDTHATIRLSNMFGQIVYTTKVSLLKGWNRERIDLNQHKLASGLYTVELYTHGSHESLKMIKAK